MLLTYIAYALSGVIGLGIIFVGARFLLAPRTAAAGYGVPAEQQTDRLSAYLAAKCVRDIASGCFVFVLIAFQAPHILGWVIVAATIIPIFDAIIVLRHNGVKAIAYGVHGATAAVMPVTAGLLLTSLP
ncbi:MAG: DUF4267 domain-containing protein [Ktedonobacterales bacterium]